MTEAAKIMSFKEKYIIQYCFRPSCTLDLYSSILAKINLLKKKSKFLGWHCGLLTVHQPENEAAVTHS